MSTRTESEDIRAKIFGPTLDESGRIRACSASQVKTHKLCPRKWWYQKVKKVPKGPKGKGAQESTESHDRMEIYLKTGGDVRNGVERFGEPMLAEWLDRMPWKPGGDMMVEEPLLDPMLRTPAGVQVTGFFDGALPPRWLAELLELPVVLDHKFLKDVDKWAAKKEELETDEPQATMYMAWILTKYPDAPAVRFRHHNHQKKGPRKNSPVEVKQTRAQVFERMAKLGRYIDTDMQATAQCKTETEARAVHSACGAFGGCEYLKMCPDAPHNRFMRALAGHGDLPDALRVPSRTREPAAQTGYDFMGLMDDLDLGDAPPPPSGAANPPPKAASSAPAAAAASTAKTPLKALEAQACVKGGVYMLPGGAPGKCKGTMDDKVLFVDKDKQVVELELDDLVRDLTTDPVATELFKRKLGIVDVVEPGAAKVEPKPAPKGEVPGGNPPPPSAKAGVIPADAPGDTNAEEKKPPTPAASTEVKVTVAEAVASADPKPEAAPTPAGKKTRGPNKPKGDATGFILIVDAASSAGESLEEYVATLAQNLRKEYSLADLRLAPKDSPAAFMGWRGLLAIEARKNLPAAGTVLVGSSGDLADPVIEALAPVAAIYIKGSRR